MLMRSGARVLSASIEKKVRKHDNDNAFNRFYPHKTSLSSTTLQVGSILFEKDKENNGQIICSQFVPTNKPQDKKQLKKQAFRTLVIEKKEEKQQKDTSKSTKTKAHLSTSKSDEKLNAITDYFNVYTPKNGTKVIPKRSVTINNDAVLFLYSPERSNQTSDSIHKKKNAKVNLALLENKMLDFSGNTAIVKGKGETLIVPSNPQKNRKESGFKSQTTVMGKTAEQALKDLIKNNKSNYSSEQLSVLQLLADAFYMEWLHRFGVGLAPKQYNTQVPNNLGAAPKWINTLMMPLESLARKLAGSQDTIVSIKSEFEMLPDSEVIEKINFNVTIDKNGKKIVVSQTIQALELPNDSNWPSSTDARQIEQVVESLLEDEEPEKRTVFKVKDFR